MSPRELNCTHLNALVAVDGIATKCSTVRPKVARSVHYCEDENIHSDQTYHDATSLTGFPTGSVYPTKDAAGHPLSTEFGLSEYRDHQTLVLHEMPERTPAGLLPSAVDVVLSDDLVDICKPGDRVQVVGIYRSVPSAASAGSSGVVSNVVDCNFRATTSTCHTPWLRHYRA